MDEIQDQDELYLMTAVFKGTGRGRKEFREAQRGCHVMTEAEAGMTWPESRDSGAMETGRGRTQRHGPTTPRLLTYESRANISL